MYRHHEHEGWGGCWGHPRWGWGGGPFIERRVGYPLLGGMGMGGLGLGGGGLVGDLLAGGVGYLVGKNSAQNQQQYQQYPQYQPQYPQAAPQYQQYPQYQPNQPQYQQPAPQYQPPAPQYQPAQAPANSPQDSQLAQLNLLGRLRTQGVLTDAEFQAEKQKILNGG